MGELFQAARQGDVLAWFRGPDGRPRHRRYMAVALTGSLLIWTLALLLFWLIPQTWKIDYSLILPSSDPDGRVSLKDVGQAYTTARATYDGKSLDPRVNYREILLNDDVLKAAADLLGMRAKDFGEPRVKLIDQSSVIEIRVKGGSPEEALAKAKALQTAFSTRLSTLRSDEIALREQAVEQTMLNARNKLTRAQQDLLNFKVKAHLVSPKQLEAVTSLASQLEQKAADTQQKLASDTARAQSLGKQLGVSPKQAAWTLTLQADAVFMDAFKQYGSALSDLTEASYKWGNAHPKVREAQGLLQAAERSMSQRASAIASPAIDLDQIRRFGLILQDRSRTQLLSDLVTAAAAMESGQAELKVVRQQLADLAGRMPELAQEAAQLDELQSRVSFTEAVFTGVAGKTDIGNTNLYSSYPLVQTLVEPVLPETPSILGLLFVAAGAMASSMMFLTALSLAWMRAKQ